MKSLSPLNQKGGNVGIVHRDIRDSVHRFHGEMLRLESQTPVGSFQPGPASPETMSFFEAKKQSQMYSRVLQVFALLVYLTEGGRIYLQLCLEWKIVWPPLNQLTEMFQREKSVISWHIRNVFDERKLVRKGVVAYFATTAADGKTCQVEFFNHDVIFSAALAQAALTGSQAELRKRGSVARYATVQTQGGNRVTRKIDFVNIGTLGASFSRPDPDLSGGRVTL